MHRASTVRHTYKDHQSIPEDHRRHEIVDGELFVTPTPRVNHQRVAVDVILALEARAREHDLGMAVGPITVHLHDELVLEPDVVFIRKDRLEIAAARGFTTLGTMRSVANSSIVSKREINSSDRSLVFPSLQYLRIVK